MKTLVLILALLPALCFAQDSHVDSMKKEIASLKKELELLRTRIEEQNNEITRLKVLCITHNIDPEPTPSNEKQLEADKPIFGIYLGEHLVDLQKRYDLTFLSKHEDLTSSYLVHNHHDSVKFIVASFYHDQVQSITVSFKDTSRSNLDAIKEKLERTYSTELPKQLTVDPKYSCRTTVGNRPLQIMLRLDDNFSDDDLVLDYVDVTLYNQAEEELKHHKADKLGSEL